MSGGVTGTHVVGETGWTADDNARDTAILALQTTAANIRTASYTLVLADAGKIVELNVAAANTVTVPPNSSVAFPVGTLIEVSQYGAGGTTVAAGSGVTIVTPLASLAVAARYGSLSLRKRATDEWVVS